MTTEIRSELRMDDKSSAVTEKIGHGLEHVSEKASEVQHELLGMVKQSLAVAAGFQLDHGIESLKELGGEAFKAAEGAITQQKAIAGLMTMTDKSGASFEKLTEQAEEVHDQLETMGIRAGVSTDQVIEAFGQLASRSQRPVEELVDLTDKLTIAGKAVPGGVEALSGAMRDMEAGFIRPRNALIQLMVQTHTVEGGAKKVAKSLGEMFAAGKQDEVMKLAETAVERMADKMKKAPPSFAGVITSLKDIRENIFEAMGVPMVKAITPPLSQLKKYFIDNRDAIEHWASTVGTKVGAYMVAAADKMKQGFQYLQTHAEEIKAAIESGVETARSVVAFIVAHKEEIALAFGAKMAVPVVKGALGAGSEVAGMLSAAGKAGAFGIAGGGLASFAVATAAFAAAVGAWALATGEWRELMRVTAGGKSDAQLDQGARKDALSAIAGSVGGVDTKEFDHLRQMYVDEAQARGEDARAAGQWVDSLWNQHEALQRVAQGFDEAAQRADMGSDQGVAEFISIYNAAATQHSAALQQYAANVLGGNEQLFNALIASGAELEGGFDHLGDLVMGKSQEFGKILKSMGGAGGGGAAAAHPVLHMSGGQTFNIKQEFRDQDPDRVAVAFMRKTAEAAMNRTQARLGVPFGL